MCQESTKVPCRWTRIGEETSSWDSNKRKKKSGLIWSWLTGQRRLWKDMVKKRINYCCNNSTMTLSPLTFDPNPLAPRPIGSIWTKWDSLPDARFFWYQLITITKKPVLTWPDLKPDIKRHFMVLYNRKGLTNLMGLLNANSSWRISEPCSETLKFWFWKKSNHIFCLLN